MRKLGLAAAAILVLACVVAAGWLGGALAELRGDGKQAGASGAAHEDRRKEGQSPLAWAEGAGKACALGDEATRALVTLAALEGEPRSQRKLLLRLVRRATRIEGGVLARLERLPPPHGERRTVRRVLTLVRRKYAGDKQLVGTLERRWDDTLLAEAIRRERAQNGEIRLRLAQLGAFGCVAYFS